MDNTMAEQLSSPLSLSSDSTLDATGLICPLPLLKTKIALQALNSGDVLLVKATDRGSIKDIPAFCDLSDHTLVAMCEHEHEIHFWVKK